jgi:hypothetical protein
VDLFDGTVRLEVIEAPPVGIVEHLLRVNLTHKTKAVYSADKTPIGPKAEDFFPNRSDNPTPSARPSSLAAVPPPAPG